MGDIREPPTLSSESTGERNEQNASNIRDTLDTDEFQALTAGNFHLNATTTAALPVPSTSVRFDKRHATIDNIGAKCFDTRKPRDNSGNRHAGVTDRTDEADE